MAPTPLSTVRCSGKGNDEEEEESGGNQGVIIGITVVVVLLLAVVLTFHTQIVAYIKTQLKGGECYTLNTWVEGGINLILHVGIFSMFVCIFFFTVVHSVEKLTIYRNLRLTVDRLVQDLEASMQTPIDVDFHVEEDAETKRQDQESERKIKQLTRKGLTLFGTLLLLSIVTSAALYFGMYAYAKWKYLPCAAREVPCCRAAGKALQPGVHYPDIRAIFRHNLVVLGFVFVTECFFLFAITLNYRSLDPNAVRKVVIEGIMESADITPDDGQWQDARCAEHDAA